MCMHQRLSQTSREEIPKQNERTKRGWVVRRYEEIYRDKLFFKNYAQEKDLLKNSSFIFKMTFSLMTDLTSMTLFLLFNN